MSIYIRRNSPPNRCCNRPKMSGTERSKVFGGFLRSSLHTVGLVQGVQRKQKLITADFLRYTLWSLVKNTTTPHTHHQPTTNTLAFRFKSLHITLPLLAVVDGIFEWLSKKCLQIRYFLGVGYHTHDLEKGYMGRCRCVLFYQGIAPAHSVLTLQAKLRLHQEPLAHAPYSPDLVIGDRKRSLVTKSGE